MWAIDLKGNARTSGERRRQEGGNVFDDKIRVGIAIYFLIRRRSVKGFRAYYDAIDDYTKSSGKINYITSKMLDSFDFREIIPDKTDNWLNQSNSDFENLVPIANRETKLAKTPDDKRAVFGLYSLGVVSNRDEWVYDFDQQRLSEKVRFFCTAYSDEMQRLNAEGLGEKSIGDWVDRSIKWTSELEAHLLRGDAIAFDRRNIVSNQFRPYVAKRFYYAPIITHRRYQMPQIFPKPAEGVNQLICFSVNHKDFYVLASTKLVDLHFTGDTQCLPLYRYTDDGERVCNITDWAIQHINDHYREDWGKDFHEIYPDGISAEEIFAYTYAVLHDPVYRHDYRVDLLREFPRLPLYRDFDLWAKMGRELLDLHINFESAEPYALERHDKAPLTKSSDDNWNPKPRLRADKERGIIALDEQTTLSGVPSDAWRYVLGSRSALEWVLDQYKEKKPRDPTIREKFNTYRFADHKERVIDLLKRVCTVSVKTMEIVDGMAYWDGDKLVVFGDRDRDELAMLAWSQLNSEPEDEEWLASWSET